MRILGLAIVLAACSSRGSQPAPSADAAVAAKPVAPAGRAPGYDQPPQHVLDVLHAPSPPSPSISPTLDRVLLISWVEYPPMAQVAEPYLKLAGVRLEPRTRRKHDTPGGYGIAPCAQTASIVEIASGAETTVALPPGGCTDAFTWSADGQRFAFRNTTYDAVELWVGDVKGAVHRLGDARLNPMLGSSLQWMADQKTLLVKLIPDDAGPPPADAIGAEGPGIQETDGQAGEFSTYEARDTLASKADEAKFEYYGTSQLAFVDSDSGAITELGAPAVYTVVDAAPDDQHVLVKTIRKPYSYAVTYDRFAHDVAIWDRAGAITKLAELPVADRVPVHGVPTGPRSHGWRPNEPATLVWAEALDGGDWNTTVPARDKVMAQRAPFTSPAAELARTEQRYGGIDWTERKDLALLSEYDDNKHWQRTYVWNPDDPAAKPGLLWDLSSDERYFDPGNPVYRALPDGTWVVRLDGDSIFLAGQGATPDGDRPFLDRLDLVTRKSERRFHCADDAYESFVGFAGGDPAAMLIWHQSPTDPPNLFEHKAGAAPRAVTHLPDPAPAVRAIKKRLVKYTRADGTKLSFTIYTPPDYQAGTRVPAILYAYPLDYASSATAGQVSGSDQKFTNLSDYQLLLLSGYAIIDQAAFPIVGDPRKAYDTYIEQLRDDAQAAVDAAVSIGVVDPERIGVTGHSHGALMTVNLLVHTDLFRAGVATSGSYNKTLTPFGFQSERRSVWDARDVYLEASPFFYADKLKLPILIMHGADDANPGTTPLQATKLFEAIRGNGGTARLVMLPHEPHWYTAMESNEQLAYEELRWFDKYVKNAAPRATK